MGFGSGLGKATMWAALLMAFSPAVAEAGKFCSDPVEGGKSSGSTQEEALLAAQKWWSSRAGALGRGYESWDNADDRALECMKGGDGTFYCKAVARPCLPPGMLPENVPKIEM
jgi:hypothetical protein